MIFIETVKEYTLYIHELDSKIYARINKRIEPTMHFDFKWEISHYCKQTETDIDVYMPTRDSENSFEAVEISLLRYMRKFTAIGVKPNKYY
jgi:hypothetical protein